jgi:CRP-like cAMP-binding protein
VSADRFVALRRAPLLADLPDLVLEQLARGLVEHSYAPHDVVVAEGETGDELFVVVEGRAEVCAAGHKGASILGTLAAGEMFGEIAMFEPNHRRTATVTALTRLRLLGIGAALFDDVASRYPSVRAAFAADAETVRIRQFLKQASPFATVDGALLRHMAARLQRIEAAAGEVIVREGDAGDRCYLVRRGEVKVFVDRTGSEHSLGVLGPGGVFGELALLTESPRSASVQATVDTELLALSRGDMMATIGAVPEVGAQLIDLVRTRERPRRNPGVLAEERVTTDGGTVTLLKQPALGTYFQLSRHGRFLWDRLDGQHGVRDLTLDYLVAFKAFAPGTIVEVISGLARGGFVETPSIRPDVVAAATRTTVWQRVAGLLDRAANVRVSFRAEPLADTLYRRGGYLLYKPVSLAVLGLIAVAGLSAFLALTLNTGAGPRVGVGIWAAAAGYAIAILCHESAHALTTKRVGRSVGRAGFAWYWFAIVGYVDTSDAWLASREQRIAVTLAGPFSDLVLGGVASLAAVLANDPATKAALWTFALVPYLAAAANLNPLLEYDGYFALIDYLNRPNLRRHALRWLGSELPSLVRDRVMPRGRALELTYGIASLFYVVLMAVVIVGVYRATAQVWLGQLLPSAVAAFLAFALAGLAVVAVLAGVATDLRGAPRRA